jgi:hypothetical protein
MYAREEKSRHPRAGGAVLRAATAHHASERDPRCLLISPSGRRHVAGKRGHVTNRSSSIIDSLSVYFFFKVIIATSIWLIMHEQDHRH